jgi:molecular chaperone DnaK
VYQTEKLLSENRDKLPESEVAEVEVKLATAKEALDSDDISSLKSAFDELTAASHKLAQAAYQPGDAGGGEAEPEAGDGGGDGDEDIIDVDYEDA